VRRRIGIRGKIAAVILICTIPVLVLAVILYAERNADRRRTVVRTQEDLAGVLAGNVTTFISTAVHTERLVGAAVTGQPYPVAGIAHLFVAIRAADPAFLRLTFARPDGAVEAGDPMPPPRTRLVDGPLEAIRAGSAWAVGPMRLAGSRPVVEVATGVVEGRRLVAIVDGTVDLSRLPVSTGLAGGSAGDAIVLDGTSSVMFDLRRGGSAAGPVRALPAVAAALAGRSAYIEAYADPAAHQRDIGAAVPISSLGWAAVVLVPESTAYESVRREALIEATWLLAYVALGLGLALVLGGELSAPIQALAGAARRVGRGEVGYRVRADRTDEVGELAAAFNDMSARLERYVRETSAVQAVSDAALSTVHLDELLPPLVQRIVAALGADGGAIWFTDENTGELVVPEAFGGSFPGAARRLQPGEGLAGRAISGYHALRVGDPDALREMDAELAAHGVQAALGVPLRAGGHPIGVIQVFSRTPREFGPEEVRLLETFADRVALAVDNARAYEREQEIGRIIQRALMPAPDVRLPGIAVAGRYEPSREVGGDFYAVLPLAGGRVGLAIADVAGKGIPAATLAARARYLLEALALDGRDPADVLTRLNGALTQRGGSLFVSLFYAVFDPDRGVLRFSNAGHVPPVLLGAGAAEPATIESAGLLLGILPEARYESRETPIGPGDLLVLFTDGLTEARRPDGELFEEARLAAVIAAGRDRSPAEIADAVMDAVTAWAETGPRDDRALAVIRVLRAGVAPRTRGEERPVTAAPPPGSGAD
jgi:sigma-B regulation protein RsbU (phosphoserine phosphatase)